MFSQKNVFLNMQEIIESKTKRELNIVMKKTLSRENGEPIDNNKQKLMGLPMRRVGRM